jgi:hypothetical protein
MQHLILTSPRREIVQNVNVQVNNHNINVNNNNTNNYNNMQRNSVTSNNEELKAVLAKYVKSKLPSHLKQKNPCLYTTSPNDTADEKFDEKDINNCCKSLDVKINIKQENSLNVDRKNSKYKFNTLDSLANVRRDSFGISEGGQSERNANMCIICCEKSANAVFMDCGHSGICYDCSQNLWKNGEECHLCRKVFSVFIF